MGPCGCSWLWKNVLDLPAKSRALELAAHLSKWSAVKWLYFAFCCEHAGHSRHHPALEAGLRQVALAAASESNLDFIMWMQSLPRLPRPPCTFSVDCVAAAAKCGHFTFLRWAWEHAPEMCPPLCRLFEAALVHQDVDTLEWMLTRGAQIDIATLVQDTAHLGSHDWDSLAAVEV